MPIVLVHGVGVRDRNFWPDIDDFLKTYICPVIAPQDSDGVPIMRAFWGDHGGKLRWEGASRPATPLLGMGATLNADELAAATVVVSDLPASLAGLPPTQPLAAAVPPGLIAAGAGGVAASTRPRDLTDDQLSDLLATLVHHLPITEAQRTEAAIAADIVAHDPATREALHQVSTLQAEVQVLEQRTRQQIADDRQARSNLIAQGGGWFDSIRERFRDRLGEAFERGVGAPGFVLSRAIGEMRGPLNNMATDFIRDVFEYLDERGTAQQPGPIPLAVIDTLKQAGRVQDEREGEAIVVLTHSMGGQIVYDLVSAILPADANNDIRIDFWCATASQVGLFEELKLFLNSNEKYSKKTDSQVPLPDTSILGRWWNVWDYNDFISFTAKPIFDGVSDDDYNSGMSLIGAHGGYLKRPSFFRRFAEELKQAAAIRWYR